MSWGNSILLLQNMELSSEEDEVSGVGWTLGLTCGTNGEVISGQFLFLNHDR